MPIIKKVTTVGAGRGICLPKSWLDWVERQTGHPLREVLLEIDNTLTIIPFIDGKQVKSKDEY